MEWKEEHDVLLCREILVSQPFKFKERTVERGKIWDEIANRLNNCQTKIPCEQAISQRAI